MGTEWKKPLYLCFFAIFTENNLIIAHSLLTHYPSPKFLEFISCSTTIFFVQKSNLASKTKNFQLVTPKSKRFHFFNAQKF